MGRAYCDFCKNIREYEVISKKEVFKVKGEAFSIDSSIAQCSECGKEIFVEALDEKNLETAYAKYREAHRLLFPSQIKEIRSKYGLSQKSLARLLGWGEITVHRYETGALQDDAHDEVLKLIDKPENMLEIYETKGQLLSSFIRDKVSKKIEALIKDEIPPKFDLVLDQYLHLGKAEDEFTGYKIFDFEKIKATILYILNFQETFRTKINKLLFYIDFLHYRQFSVSITGNSYIHYPYGPVPDKYELIIGAMLEENLISKEEVIRHSEVREQLRSVALVDDEMFSSEERATADFVLNKFKDFTCTQLSEYSHNEIPYKNTNLCDKISYNLADQLSLSMD